MVVLDAANMQWGQTYSGGSSQRMMARSDSDVRLAARVRMLVKSVVQNWLQKKSD